MVTIKRILFPIDFSECSYDVAPYVLSISEKFEATVYLLYVARDLRHFAGFHVPHTSISLFTKELLEGSERLMDKVCNDYFDRCPNFQRKVVIGDPGEEILRTAEEEGLDRTLFGSVAGYVVKHSSVPVLTVNPYRLRQRQERAA